MTNLIQEEAVIRSQTTELLTPAQEIFNEGVQLASTFESAIQNSIDDFYRNSIPFAYKCQEQKPWKSREYGYLDSMDPNDSLLRFLRASFGFKSSQKTAQQQATVLGMIVKDGLTYEDVAGIWFRYLLKMAYAVGQVSRDVRLQLLQSARTCKNIQEFEAIVESAKQNVNIEPKKTKLLQGSRSAIDKLNEFADATKKLGDNRPEAEKLADFAGAALYTELDFAVDAISKRTLGAYCRYIRRREPAFENVPDAALIADVIFVSWEMEKEDMDPDSLEEFLEIETMRQANKSSP